MDAKSVRSIVVVFLGSLLLLLAAVLCSEGNRKIFQTLCGGNRFHLISQKIHQHTAEQVWSRCWKETEGSTETGRDFVTYLQYAVISRHNSKLISSEFLRKRKLEKAIAGLSPQAQHGLQDCLRRNYFHFQTLSNEIVSMKWFNKCLEIKFGPPHVPRRFLKQRHLIGTPSPGPGATSPDNAPSPATTSPADAPGPAATSPSADAPGPDVTSPTDSPGSSAPLTPPVDAPDPASKLGGDSPKKSSPGSISPPTTSPSRPKKSSQPPPAKAKPPHPDAKSSNDDQTYIVIAAAGGGAVLFTLGALLIICRSEKKHKIDPQDGKRDENNLLSVGLSDLSGDSKSSDGVSKLSTAGQVSASGVTGGASGPGLTALPLPPGRAPPPAPMTPPPPPPPAPKAAAPPPPPAPKPPGPKPPPPPKGARPPPVPLGKPAPPGAHRRGRSSGGGSADEAESQKTKLKPFFWDKTTANIDNSMVWHELKAGSFQVNEEMMESLFGYVPTEKKSNERRKESSSLESAPQFIQIIDPKKSQNLAILLKALNVTTVEVCDALKEGNELPVELVQTLLKMAPSSEEELKLRLYNGDLALLGPAERFLKTIVEIPFAFKRLEALLFMSCVQEELTTTKEAFETLEVACTELKKSRLFLKLLEAVLKTGNRMNDGTYRGGAQAFKLDTLLKLSDVKGLDGKTTLLHFVVQEIIRSEGAKAARQARESKSLSNIKIDDLTEDSGPETAEYLRDLGLGVVSRLSTDLKNVKKAAAIDGDCLTGSLSKVGQSLIKTRDFLNNELKNMEEDSEFFVTISNFVKNAETEITRLQAEEKRITALVKSTVDYFHGSSGKDEGLRLFVIVRDFLVFLDRSCDDIRKKALAEAAAAAVAAKAANKAPKRESSSVSTVAENKQPSMPDIRQKLFPVIQDRRVDDSSSSSSDDES